MQVIKRNVLFLILFFSAFSSHLIGQDKVEITGTSLKINLEEGAVMNPNSAVISYKNYDIAFMEMAGVNFYDQRSDFESIELKYLAKGIVVKKNVNGKIGEYDAQLVTLGSKPAVYQIFLGDKDFCAVINVIANDTTYLIDETEVKAILSSIEYKKSAGSDLEKHANFVIRDENDDWKFTNYVSNFFVFENKNTKDGLLIGQLPPETLIETTAESLVKDVVKGLKDKTPNLKVIEEGPWKMKDIEGYRTILDVSEDGNGNLGLVYLFIFGNDKSTFMVQGLGTKNDAPTKLLYDNLLKSLEFKK
jgi:hypothetical protein